MKKLNFWFLLAGFCLVLPLQIEAQEAAKNQAFWIHEDVVKPAKIGDYEKVCKELLSEMKKHNITDQQWMAASTNDNRYMFIGEIDNMAELDEQPFATLSEKMGKEAMSNLFGNMNKCYDIEHDYVVHHDPELSYSSATSPSSSENLYRKWHFLYISPENAGEVKENMMTIKSLFQDKGSEISYNVYRSGFGTRGSYYLVSVGAKDAVHYAERAAANDELLGEEGEKAFGKLFASLLDYEEVTGQMRPDLAYQPNNVN